MTDAITKFNIDLQAHLKDAQNRLASLNAQASASVEHANTEVLRQIAALEERAHHAKASVEAANAEMRKWADDSISAVADWKAKRDVSRLVARADRAEQYAKAASQVAVAGVEAAEKAALDARLARSEAVDARASRPV